MVDSILLVLTRDSSHMSLHQSTTHLANIGDLNDVTIGDRELAWDRLIGRELVLDRELDRLIDIPIGISSINCNRGSRSISSLYGEVVRDELDWDGLNWDELDWDEMGWDELTPSPDFIVRSNNT
jgi:hypothetical protein